MYRVIKIVSSKERLYECVLLFIQFVSDGFYTNRRNLVTDEFFFYKANLIFKSLPLRSAYTIFPAVRSLLNDSPSFNDLAYSPTLDKFVGVCNNNTFMREAQF